jgi:inactivated superfamily I helicase
LATDTKQLLQGLQEYYRSLERHLEELRSEYQQLENNWQAFNSVAEGNYADQFRGGWLRTHAQFQEYIKQSEKIKLLLGERIESLSQLNREEGSIP